MTQPEPPTPHPGSDEPVPSGTTVGVAGSEHTTLSDIHTLGGDLTVSSGAPVVQGDWVAGDQFSGDKVYGDKITHIQDAPKAKPTLPAETPHNLPTRATSAGRFLGRSQELEHLKSLLAPEGSRAYLTGMGGVGKSELAIQHAYESFDVYRGGIVRLDARQGLEAMAQQVITFFRGVFPEVALPEDKSPTELLPACWSQWPTIANPPEPVLLILDDQRGDKEGYVAECKLLEGLPPRFRRLITQRETAPTTAQAIDLALLQRVDSLRLLALQSGVGSSIRLQAEQQAADALCAEVGDLPLALVLLGARLAECPDLKLKQLLAELQAKGAAAKALSQAHPELGARLGVVQALFISWEPLTEPAKSLALLLSVMAPAMIPWVLVEACRLPGQQVEEGTAFGDEQAELLRAQFLERVGEGLYQLHPLVRQFLKLQVGEQPEVVARWRKQLAAAVAGVCRERIPQTLTLAQVQALERDLPHIRLVAEQLAEELEEEDLLWPTMVLARVAEHQAAFAEALKWNELGLEQCERRLGAGHPSTATALNELVTVMYATNRLTEAEPLMRRALAIDEACYGSNHPNVARDLNNLALLLQNTNRPEDAVSLYRRAQEIDEANYGSDHPEVAIDLNNLAQLLQATNCVEEAEPLMRRALAIDEASYGSNHPKVAIRLNNLAKLLKATSRLEEAEPLYRRSLEIYEANYGPSHGDVATALNNLAQLLKATNRLEEAEPLMRRMVEIFIAVQRQGYQHPNLQAGLYNYIALLQEMSLTQQEIQAKFQRLMHAATSS